MNRLTFRSVQTAVFYTYTVRFAGWRKDDVVTRLPRAPLAPLTDDDIADSLLVLDLQPVAEDI